MNKRQRKPRKRIVRKRMNFKQPIVYVKPDHRVVVKFLGNYSENNLANGYFDCYDIIKPYHILASSSYAPLLEIYESMRVTKIKVKTWIGSVATTTPGYTSAFLYRDVLTNVPQRYVEQLIVEPGSKTGRMITKYNFTWLPIEPSDYEFYDHNQFGQMDDRRYGQVNYAGAATNITIEKPLLEYTVYYDFKTLIKPPVVLNIQRTEREETESESDSEIEVVPRSKSIPNVLTKSTITDLVNMVGKLTTK